MHIYYDRPKGILHFNHRDAIDALAHKLGIASDRQKRKILPIDPHLDLPKYLAPQDGINSIDYLSVIGSCLHICQVSRPDCSFAVGVLCRHSATPGAIHMTAVLNLVQYMYHTRDWYIQYTRSQDPGNTPEMFEQGNYALHEKSYHNTLSNRKRIHDNLSQHVISSIPADTLPSKLPAKSRKQFVAAITRTIEERLVASTPTPLPNDPNHYSDADLGGCKVTRRSTSGNITMMNGGPIVWGSRLQKLCALSSAESEIYAVLDGVKEALHIKLLCEECGIRTQGIPMTIWEDNNACIQLGHNLRGSNAAKHFEMRLRLLNEHIYEGNIEFSRIDTKDQLADGFTKPLPYATFASFRSNVMVLRPDF
jgi:hypothetical protein